MTPYDLPSRLDRYIALRRALGFAMHAEERLLRQYVGFVEEHGHGRPLRAHVAFEWACSAVDCGPGGRTRRLNLARAFLAHLRASLPDAEIPPHGLLAHAVRPKPHIYSSAEIEALIGAAWRLRPCDSLRPHTVATIIGLLASSGLRAGEATRLRNADVELDRHPPHLHVRETKFRKSRLVPLHPSTADRLRQYAAQRHCLGYDGLCENFFVSERGEPTNYRAVARTFIAMTRRLGIRAQSGDGPTLHDLRHTFAVQRLVLWHRDGVDVQSRLPELSVYLGHVCPQATYWYLTATPELLAAAATKFESFVGATS